MVAGASTQPRTQHRPEHSDLHLSALWNGRDAVFHTRWNRGQRENNHLAVASGRSDDGTGLLHRCLAAPMYRVVDHSVRHLGTAPEKLTTSKVYDNQIVFIEKNRARVRPSWDLLRPDITSNLLPEPWVHLNGKAVNAIQSE